MKFGILDFVATLPAEGRPELPVGRLTQNVLHTVGLRETFLAWRKEQYRLLKLSKPRTDDVREKDRVNKAVSRFNGSRAEALVHIDVKRSDNPGPVPRVPRIVNVVVHQDVRSALLDKLERTSFSGNAHKRSALAQGQSKTFGTVFSRKDQDYGESWTSTFNPNLYALLRELAQKEIPDFSYTTIGVNKNVVTRPHTDKYNVGPTMILALGNFQGGDLVVRGKTFVLSEMKWLYFWGKDEHYNTPIVRGVKYTVTYFTLLPPYAPSTAATHASLGRIH